MAQAIHTEQLGKRYGSTVGIDGVDLDVSVGEVFGFIGPNGAGKTTTIRILLDLIRATSGRARVLGMETRTDSLAIRHRIGYVPGELAFYETMTGGELLGYVTALRGHGVIDASAGFADRLDLDLTRRIREYSSGNRQKLALVQAFMHRPELLILDEPTRGLDPLVQQEFYRMVEEVRSEGRTVFLSSHVLPEVERVADRVGIIRGGRLMAVESVESLERRALRRLEITFADPVDADPFASLPSVRSATTDRQRRVVELVVEGELDEVVKAAAAHRVVSLVSHERDLEETFLSYYREDPEGVA